jgi:hypothetical protein
MPAIKPIKGADEMQYLLMIYRNEAEFGNIDAAEAKKMMEEYGAFTQSIIQSGNFKAGDRLQPATTARRNARAARRLLSDRGQGSRRSAGHRRAHSRRPAWFDRGQADLGL